MYVDGTDKIRICASLFVLAGLKGTGKDSEPISGSRHRTTFSKSQLPETNYFFFMA